MTATTLWDGDPAARAPPQGDGVVSRFAVELCLAPNRFPPGEPAGGRHARDFVQQPDRGDTAANHDDMQAPELLSGNIVRNVELPPFEGGRPG